MRTVVEPGGTGTRAYILNIPWLEKQVRGKNHLKKRGYADDMWVSTFFGVLADNPNLQWLFL